MARKPTGGAAFPTPRSYEEYLLLSEKDKLRLIEQEQAEKPNTKEQAHGTR